MARDLKPHIGIFGRRNSGKSSLINLLTGSYTAIVSPTAGTTTDPVKKSIEIFGVGPCVIIDTAGIDDIDDLGQQRIDKSLKVLDEIDCAIIVISGNLFGEEELNLITMMRDRGLPFLIIHNKADIMPLSNALKEEIAKVYNGNILDISVLQTKDTNIIIQSLKNVIPQSAYAKVSLLGGIVSKGDTVVLVCPIDSEAPEGRMILPQVMTIRDALDNDTICVVVKEDMLKRYLDNMPAPSLVITDSQVFGMVSKIVPSSVRLTSFSIVMARLRGDFENYLKGTPRLAELRDGDTILMLESCTHQVSCDDIGRVKLPNMIRRYSGKDINFDYVAGLNPINNVDRYAMAIQCGGCMATRRQLLNRTGLAVRAGIPISNYGMAIAFMTGIFDRVTAPFININKTSC